MKFLNPCSLACPALVSSRGGALAVIPPDMRLQEGKHPSLIPICILRFHFFLSLPGEDEFKMEFKDKQLGLGGFGRQTSRSQEECKGLAPERPSPTS